MRFLEKIKEFVDGKRVTDFKDISTIIYGNIGNILDCFNEDSMDKWFKTMAPNYRFFFNDPTLVPNGVAKVNQSGKIPLSEKFHFKVKLNDLSGGSKTWNGVASFYYDAHLKELTCSINIPCKLKLTGIEHFAGPDKSENDRYVCLGMKEELLIMGRENEITIEVNSYSLRQEGFFIDLRFF